jgi:hypothetical protein
MCYIHSLQQFSNPFLYKNPPPKKMNEREMKNAKIYL